MPRCDGTILYTCTRSGQDEVGYDCAQYGGAYSCGAKCPGDAGACCVYDSAKTAPRCKFTVTSPYVGSGSDYLTPPDICSAPSGCAANTFSASFSHITSTCPSASVSTYFSVDRAKAPFGPTYTLPTSGITINYSVTNSPGCSKWSGTMKLISDVPNWKVAIDAICTDTDNTGKPVAVRVTGDFSGTVTQ